ncbi:hypothetical protein FRC02_007541, partial [Tulasnella sp. 418]
MADRSGLPCGTSTLTRTHATGYFPFRSYPWCVNSIRQEPPISRYCWQILELLDPSDLVSLTISTDESRAILTSANYDYLWRGCLDRFRQKLKAQREGEDSDSREEGDSDSSEEENPDSSEEENPDSSEEKTDSTIGEEDLDWSDVELPECPPGVPAWRYANMAFGDRCNYCDLPNAHCVNIFNIFTRICEPCFLNWVVPSKYILSNVLRKEEHFLFLSLPVVK